MVSGVKMGVLPPARIGLHSLSCRGTSDTEKQSMTEYDPDLKSYIVILVDRQVIVKAL